MDESALFGPSVGEFRSSSKRKKRYRTGLTTGHTLPEDISRMLGKGGGKGGREGEGGRELTISLPYRRCGVSCSLISLQSSSPSSNL